MIFPGTLHYSSVFTYFSSANPAHLQKVLEVKGEGEGQYICIAPYCMQPTSFPCTPMRLSTGGMNHTCLCLPSRS